MGAGILTGEDGESVCAGKEWCQIKTVNANRMIFVWKGWKSKLN